MTRAPTVRLSPYEHAVNHLNQLTPALHRIFAAALDDLRRQRDEQATRCRAATQALIEEVGADGPMSLEQVVEKTRVRLASLKALATEQGALARISELEKQVAKRNWALRRYRETVQGLENELRYIDDELAKL